MEPHVLFVGGIEYGARRKRGVEVFGVTPMFGISFVRVASVTAAFFVASFISFPSFPSSGLLSLTPSISINREFKGDRLPLVAPSPAETRRELGMRAPPSESQSREKVPVGCDSAFS